MGMTVKQMARGHRGPMNRDTVRWVWECGDGETCKITSIYNSVGECWWHYYTNGMITAQPQREINAAFLKEVDA